MAFVKVDDGTGQIDLVVFPKIFKSTRDFWLEGKPLLVVGKVDFRDETPSILVENIETLSSLSEKKQREVYIKIPASADANTLRRLKDLLTSSLGDQTAYLIFDNNGISKRGKKVKLPFQIFWNETLAKGITDILETAKS